MNWILVLIVVAVVAFLLVFKRFGEVSSTAAAAYLAQGAMVVDVRSQAEFEAGHLRHAINVPLDQIDAIVTQRAKDKNQVLLLHCQSGMRSGVARRKLEALGYARAFNLGSYDRAARIVNAR